MAATAFAGVPFRAASPVAYRLSFPEAVHHTMQVVATFSDLDASPLELRISQSSPGRYALQDFAKNVYDVHAFDSEGRELALARPDPSGWTVPTHGRTVTVKYKVFGDQVDGTYLAIDAVHAHINMPAAIMFARGFDDRPMVLQCAPPPGVRWQAATQLHASSTPCEFTAPNLQYLMDSPLELGPLSTRDLITVPRVVRVALHHEGPESDLDAVVPALQKIVREEGEIFKDYPAYEGGAYTFIVDYLREAAADGMEHRNSAVVTLAGDLRSHHGELLESVAHEFFHSWNVERIRPRSLEPFDFDRANLSGELWLAEGFTEYYAPLVLSRTGLVDLAGTASAFSRLVSGWVLGPGRLVRSAEDMSRMAPFVDGSRPADRTNWSNTVVSYYSAGGAIALALDLSLRGRSGGRITLDDYMQQMWRAHGKPGGPREGYVDRPYTMADAEARLAEVSGDAAFARDFFARFIQGREAADYQTLVGQAGLTLRRASPRRASWGEVRLEASGAAVRLVAPTQAGSPAYEAGLDIGDEVRQIGRAKIASVDDVAMALSRKRPGDTVTVAYISRGGISKTAVVRLAEDPRFDIVPIESVGGVLSSAQREFRRRWLGPKER